MRKESIDFDAISNATSKRTNRTKNRSNHTRSEARSNIRPNKNIKGLITDRQSRINKFYNQQQFTNTQGTQYTHQTGRSQSIPRSQDFQINYEELQREEEAHEIFINKEEEQMIQTILQIARKGKINKKNAFQIPLKLASQEILNPSLNKFWKFASELLGASISIYDKRIENIWMDTHKIHDKLVRINLESGKSGSEDDEDNYALSNAGRNNLDEKGNIDFLILPIEQYRKTSLHDSIKHGQATLQDSDKLNIKKLEKNYNGDPLFSKKLMTFDNSSNNSLLLNVFEMGTGCQIQMFTQKTKLEKKNKEPLLNKIITQLNNDLISQSLNQDKINNYQLKISVTDRITKLRQQVKNSKNDKNSDIDFDQKNDRTVKEAALNNNLADKELENILQEEFDSYWKNIETGDNLRFQSVLEVIDEPQNIDFTNTQNNLSENFMNSVPPENFQRQNMHEYYSQQNPISPYPDSQTDDCFKQEYFHSSQHSHNQFSTVMTPWQIEFKDGKIKRKRNKNRSNNQSMRKKKEKIQDNFVDFDALVIEKRDKVLKIDKEKDKVNKKKSKKKDLNDNLVPPQMVIYEKYNYAKTRDYTRVAHEKMSSDIHPQPQNQLASFLAPDPSMLQPIQNQPFEEQQPTSNILALQNLSQKQISTQLRNPITSLDGYKRMNIRELKKIIFEQVTNQRTLRLSQIDLDVDPSNILLTFLHLANEKNLVVKDIEDQSDIILAWE